MRMENFQIYGVHVTGKCICNSKKKKKKKKCCYLLRYIQRDTSVCQAIVYVWWICIYFSSFLIMSKACVFPMTVSCNEVIFGNCFFHIYWALFIDSSVNICLFKIVAFSSEEINRFLLLFEKLFNHHFTLSTANWFNIVAKWNFILGHFTRYLLRWDIIRGIVYRSQLFNYILSFLFFFFATTSEIAEASFYFSVETPTLPDNIDFFSLGFGKGENSSSDFW